MEEIRSRHLRGPDANAVDYVYSVLLLVHYFVGRALKEGWLYCNIMDFFGSIFDRYSYPIKGNFVLLTGRSVSSLSRRNKVLG